ncbi:hypothetical protein DRO66_02555 [Candidatus Bathyarchaeota archaeon]|nr:MAG: hypothetical protein DRO66_02555 [Candidatus Bathyarchaeota archaeon]
MSPVGKYDEDVDLDALCDIDPKYDGDELIEPKGEPEEVEPAVKAPVQAPDEIRIDGFDFGGRDTEVDFAHMMPAPELADLEESWDGISTLLARLHADLTILKQKELHSRFGDGILRLEEISKTIIGVCSDFNEVLEKLIQ